MKNKLKEILKVSQDVQSSDLSDEEKYNMVFSAKISGQVYDISRNFGVTFDYYDPDTSCAEDVAAFIDALSSYVEKIELLSNDKATSGFLNL